MDAPVAPSSSIPPPHDIVSVRITKAGLFVNSLLLIALLLLSPYAMRFVPFEEIYTLGVYQAHHAADPLYARRAGLIVFGLVASCVALAVCFVCFVTTFGIKTPDRSNFPRMILVTTCMGCIVTLGWRNFPYWVNGIFGAYSGLAELTDFDPKALMPMVWIGESWRIPIVIGQLAALPLVPTLLICSFVEGRRGDYPRWFWINLVIFSITAACYVRSPNYWDWLMD